MSEVVEIAEPEDEKLEPNIDEKAGADVERNEPKEETDVEEEIDKAEVEVLESKPEKPQESDNYSELVDDMLDNEDVEADGEEEEENSQNSQNPEEKVVELEPAADIVEKKIIETLESVSKVTQDRENVPEEPVKEAAEEMPQEEGDLLEVPKVEDKPETPEVEDNPETPEAKEV